MFWCVQWCMCLYTYIYIYTNHISYYYLITITITVIITIIKIMYLDILRMCSMYIYIYIYKLTRVCILEGNVLHHLSSPPTVVEHPQDARQRPKWRDSMWVWTVLLDRLGGHLTETSEVYLGLLPCLLAKLAKCAQRLSKTQQLHNALKVGLRTK